jgi:epoxyqueuosine reductase
MVSAAVASAAELERAAARMGLTVAWAPIDLPEEWKASYRQWIAERRNAGLGQLARALEVRLDPPQRFAWARSVMVIGAAQAYPDPGVPAGGVRIGRVARRFWVREPDPFGLKRLLEPCIDELKREAAALGIRARDYLDQGPLPLNLYAVASGAYWRGRNAMALSPALGTRSTLACLLTDVAVDRLDGEHPDRCGSCSRCVDACPTGALLGDRRVDLNLCISYWTTSHQEQIPIRLWDAIGGWLLGCDICQDVCPWNERAERAGEAWPGYVADPELAHPDLERIVTLRDPQFARRFAGSAFERIGRARLARNALIVLAVSGHPAAGELIGHALRDSAELVRATAEQAVARRAIATA